jgi:ribonuclease HII
VAGDAKVFSCCAAGIIAKVTRDKLIEKYHKKYPQYGFLQHKGYGTKAHFAALEKFGPCKIHRKTFWPVSKFV